MSAILLRKPTSLWQEKETEGLSEADLLLYRSNLLGSDLAITNFGGGNTSAKIRETDPLSGEAEDVLWVKGSGGDLGSMSLNGFATAYLDKLRALEKLYRGREFEDEMVSYLPHCTFGLNPRAASIDTPLHTFLPHRHIDHTHPDAVIAVAASKNSKTLTREIFGERIGWLPWQRPGFDLGLRLRDLHVENPEIEGIVLEGHGLFTWADSSRACYENTVDTIAAAVDYLNHRLAETDAFGGEQSESLGVEARRSVAARLMPAIRDAISESQPKIGHFSDSDEILEFVNSRDMRRLAEVGTSCPDHFLRTKIKPLIVDPAKFDVDQADYLGSLFSDYRDEYAAYYDRCKRSDSPPIRDANPVVYLVPGVGMITFAKDKATSRIAGEFYTNAINVMRGAEAVSEYQGLAEQEAFDIEYWQLEEAKLRRMPAPKAFQGKVALITGAAGGIGRATARRLLAEDACVVLSDIDAENLEAATSALQDEFGTDRVVGLESDVTDEQSVCRAFESLAVAFGGVDIVVANAGLASSAPIEETTLELWRRNHAVLSEGYFLVAREAFRMMKGSGGAIVFVASKNALAAAASASAYATAKAAELHLARCLALEGAPHGIRVNTVNPDAVISGSKIWTGNWRAERAAAYGLSEDQLEAHYRDRSLLKRSVLPEDVAEAITFLASERASKSTGNIINVDAGNASAFTR